MDIGYLKEIQTKIVEYNAITVPYVMMIFITLGRSSQRSTALTAELEWTVIACENNKVVGKSEVCFQMVDGNKIFEGDIVWSNYEEERGIVQWDNDTARFIITCSTFTVNSDNTCGEELEIVGNIYDNPEMMEKIEENYE